jgi:hypothetical protein
LADPTRFERATFAFGGQFLEIAAVCCGGLREQRPLILLA